jgi:hypothetical protein
MAFIKLNKIKRFLFAIGNAPAQVGINFLFSRRMKSRILDVSDCAESPMLGESRHRRQWGRRSWTSNYLVRYSELRPYGQPNLQNLTEELFTGRRAEPAAEIVADLKTEATPQPWYAEGGKIVEPSSYETKCAQRWWEEFRRWFGVQEQG